MILHRQGTQPRLIDSSEHSSIKAEQFILRNSDTKLGYETRIRNSDTKLGYETRRGFLVGLEFRNPPEFRILRTSSFRKRETKLFFLKRLDFF
jgi:hypothetical protein